MFLSGNYQHSLNCVMKTWRKTQMHNSFLTKKISEFCNISLRALEPKKSRGGENLSQLLCLLFSKVWWVRRGKFSHLNGGVESALFDKSPFDNPKAPLCCPIQSFIFFSMVSKKGVERGMNCWELSTCASISPRFSPKKNLPGKIKRRRMLLALVFFLQRQPSISCCGFL